MQKWTNFQNKQAQIAIYTWNLKSESEIKKEEKWQNFKENNAAV